MADAIDPIPFAQVKPEVLKAVHPEIQAMQTYWKRVRILLEEEESCYAVEEFFPKLPNEKQADYDKRMAVFTMGFRNPTQELVTTKADYIYKQSPTRTTDDPVLAKFKDKADRGGQSMDEVMRNNACPIFQGYGTVVGVVDKPRAVTPNLQMELEKGMPYLSILQPDQILNWAWGEDGSLAMFRYWQGAPMDASGAFDEGSEGARQYVTWTRDWYFRHNGKGERVDYLNHLFGVVPVAIQAAFLPNASKTLGKSSFFTTSRLILMANNHLSVANFEIAKYGSVLLMDRQDVDEQKNARKKEDGTNLPKMTGEAAEGSVMPVNDMANPPQYLIKDSAIIDKANAQAQWYFACAAETEATGKDPMPLSGPEQGAPQSGVSKGYDFMETDANLANTAKDLQAFEIQVFNIAAKMTKRNAAISVLYPTTFDTEGFGDKLDRILGLQKAKYPSATGIKVSFKRLTPEITSDPSEQKTIDEEIDAAGMDQGQATDIQVGDRVRVIGEPHMPGQVEGRVTYIENGALEILFDGETKPHRWYAPSEVEVISDTADHAME